MKKKLRIILCTLAIAISFLQCNRDGESIIEHRYGTLNFTTYTVDTFRFRVILGDDVLTDSLLSPQNSVVKVVDFVNPTTVLKILNTKNGQVIVDSLVSLKIGTTTIPLVQFIQGEKPYIPPVPNEAPPAAGNYKIRFQYIKPESTAVPFFDSIRVIIRRNGMPIDTINLEKYELTEFYEAASISHSFSMRLENPLTRNAIDPVTVPNIGLNYSGFNTVIITGTSATNPVNPANPYNYTLRYAY